MVSKLASTAVALLLIACVLALALPLPDVFQHPQNYMLSPFDWTMFAVKISVVVGLAAWAWYCINLYENEKLKGGSNMTWQEILTQLIKTPALWVAVVGLYHALLAWLVPTFPQAVIVAIDGVVFVIASVVTQQVIKAYVATKRLIAVLNAQIAALEAKVKELTSKVVAMAK